MGERHLFVRFLHCDAHCRYCDTPLCHEPLEAWRLEVTPGERDFVRRRESRAARIARAADPERLVEPRPSRRGRVHGRRAAPAGGRDPRSRAGDPRARAPRCSSRRTGTCRTRSTRCAPSSTCSAWTGSCRPRRASRRARRSTGACSAPRAGIACYVKAVFVEETPDEEILEAARAVADAPARRAARASARDRRSAP